MVSYHAATGGAELMGVGGKESTGWEKVLPRSLTVTSPRLSIAYRQWKAGTTSAPQHPSTAPAGGSGGSTSPPTSSTPSRTALVPSGDGQGPLPQPLHARAGIGTHQVRSPRQDGVCHVHLLHGGGGGCHHCRAARGGPDAVHQERRIYTWLGPPPWRELILTLRKGHGTRWQEA